MYSLARFLFSIYFIFSPILFLKYPILRAEENTETDTLINSKKKVLENDLNDEDYVIGPGDKFELKFIENAKLSTIFKVLKDGNVYLPIIEKVSLEGLTISEARNLLKELYSSELINPELQLSILEERAINITIIGEVGAPGVYTIGIKDNTISAKENLRVVDAIKQAGGLTKNSNLKNIELIRKLPMSQGGSKKATLNLYDLVFNGNINQNPIIFDGDFIKVSKAKNIRKLQKTNLTKSIIDD